MYGLFSELHIRSESVDLAKKLTIEVGTFEQNTYWGLVPKSRNPEGGFFGLTGQAGCFALRKSILFMGLTAQG